MDETQTLLDDVRSRVQLHREDLRQQGYVGSLFPLLLDLDLPVRTYVRVCVRISPRVRYRAGQETPQANVLVAVGDDGGRDGSFSSSPTRRRGSRTRSRLKHLAALEKGMGRRSEIRVEMKKLMADLADGMDALEELMMAGFYGRERDVREILARRMRMRRRGR